MSDSISEQFARALAALCTDERIRAVEAGGDAKALWNEVDALGFTDALVPVEHGGAGLTLAECGALFVAAGRAGLNQPFGETVVARALLAAAGHAPVAGCIALCSAQPDSGDAVVCGDVPGARLASHVLVQWQGSWLLLPTGGATQTPGSLRPHASASLRWESASLAAVRWSGTGPSADAWCNLVHAAAMAGAMERVLDLSVQYASDRRQFGRAIGQFQAVQQDLAVLAEQAGSAAVAARMGCAASGIEPLLAAAAKLRASEAAAEVARLAHAVHGAIGITEEHVLGVFTTRLHEWRAAGSTPHACADAIGAAVLRSPHGFMDFVRSTLAPSVEAA